MFKKKKKHVKKHITKVYFKLRLVNFKRIKITFIL